MERVKSAPCSDRPARIGRGKTETERPSRRHRLRANDGRRQGPVRTPGTAQDDDGPRREWHGIRDGVEHRVIGGMSTIDNAAPRSTNSLPCNAFAVERALKSMANPQSLRQNAAG